MLILLVVVGGVALMGVRNVRAKIARCRIGAAQEMTESLCCMVENYMSDHRMSEPPKDLRVLLEIDRNNNEPYLAGGVSSPMDLMAFRIPRMTSHLRVE